MEILRLIVMELKSGAKNAKLKL